MGSGRPPVRMRSLPASTAPSLPTGPDHLPARMQSSSATAAPSSRRESAVPRHRRDPRPRPRRRFGRRRGRGRDPRPRPRPRRRDCRRDPTVPLRGRDPRPRHRCRDHRRGPDVPPRGRDPRPHPQIFAADTCADSCRNSRAFAPEVAKPPRLHHACGRAASRLGCAKREVEERSGLESRRARRCVDIVRVSKQTTCARFRSSVIARAC